MSSLTCLLTKCSYLFTDKFKPTLFKLFIMNRFEYCGSAFLHSINQQCLDRLEKCFAKSILRFLKMNIFSLTGKDEFTFLSKFNIFPLKYRLFFHFCTFLFNLFKNNNIFTTKDNNYKKINALQGIFIVTNYGKYSFLTISTKLLNSFIAKHLEMEMEILL